MQDPSPQDRTGTATTMGGSDDSDWGEEAEQQDDEEEEESPEKFAAKKKRKSATTKNKPKPAPTPGVPQGRRIRPTLRRVNFEEEGQDILDHLPSYERITEHGGYAHTQSTRKKIANANRGNRPWNYGKERSDAAKSKISAGVRARNQALLMAKLQTLGMTEDEWYVKKREIKYIRERVRRAKLVAKKHAAELERLPWKRKGSVVKMGLMRRVDGLAIAPKQEPETKVETSSDDDSSSSSSEEEFLPQPPPPAPTNAVDNDDNDDDHNPIQYAHPLPATAGQFLVKAPPSASSISMSQRDVTYTHHPYDLGPSIPLSCTRNADGTALGGLLCCDACATQHSQWLSQTYRETQQQTMHGMAKEVQELLDTIADTKRQLARTIHGESGDPKVYPTSAAGTTAAAAMETESIQPLFVPEDVALPAPDMLQQEQQPPTEEEHEMLMDFDANMPTASV